MKCPFVKSAQTNESNAIEASGNNDLNQDVFVAFNSVCSRLIPIEQNRQGRGKAAGTGPLTYSPALKYHLKTMPEERLAAQTITCTP